MSEMKLVPGALQAQAPSVPTEIEAAFVAGFRASGEGWNGEWPFEGVPDDEASFAPVLELAASHRAALIHQAATPDGSQDADEDGAWIILYEDRDREQEVFVGFGARKAAQRRYDQISVTWNAHLFERVRSALPAAPEGGK